MTTSDTNWEAAAIQGIRTNFFALSGQEINSAKQISAINIAHVCSDLFTFFFLSQAFSAF